MPVSRRTAGDLNIGSTGDDYGGFSIGNNVWIVDSGVLYRYTHSGGILTRATSGQRTIRADALRFGLRGGVASGNNVWLVNNDSDNAQAYTHSNGTLTRASSNDVSLGTGNWQGGFAVGNNVWFIKDNNSRTTDFVAYTNNNGTLTRASSNDLETIFTADAGGFSIGNNVWAVGFDRLYGYTHNNGVLTRNSSEDVSLGLRRPHANTTGGFAVGNNIWVVDDGGVSDSYLRGYSYSATPTPTPTPSAPVVTISANIRTATRGTRFRLSWTSSGHTSFTVSDDTGFVISRSTSSVRSRNITAQATRTYTIRATNSAGSSTASVTVSVTNPLPTRPTVSITASPNPITRGNSSTLSWTLSNYTSFHVRASGSNTNLATSGTSLTVSPTSTTTYIITATNRSGNVSSTKTARVTVTVNIPLPTVSISASPNPITRGQSTRLSWTVSGATSFYVRVLGTSTNIATSGTGATVSPTSTTTYIINATNSAGGRGATVTVTVTDRPTAPFPTVTISANPRSIIVGDSSTLSWTVSSHSGFTTTFRITGGGLSLTSGSSRSVSPTSSTTYTITATNSRTNYRPSTSTATVFVSVSSDTSSGDITLNSQDHAKISFGTAVISRIALGGQLYWRQGTPPTITSFTVTPTSINLDSATPTDVVIRFSIPRGSTTARVYLEPQGTQIGQTYTVQDAVNEVTDNSFTHTRPTANQTYRLVASTIRGEVHQDRSVTVTQSPGVSNIGRANFISGIPGTSGPQYTFTARIVGYPQPAVSYRFSTGETAVLSPSHLTPVSGQVNTWTLRFTHTFATVQTRNLTITAGTASQTLTNIDG